MAMAIRVLILEDRPDDAELMVRELRRAGFEPHWQRVEDEAEYLACLAPDLDLILADYSQPQFDALRALVLLQERELDIPFIVVTGAIGEEEAVACIQAGATDYLLKDRLARLGPAAVNALEQRRLRAERRQAEERLKVLSRAVEQSPASIVITDTQGQIEYVNPKFTQVTGYELGEVLGRNPRLLKSGRVPPEIFVQLWETIAAGEEWRGELCNRKKSGELYWEFASISSIKNTEEITTHYLAVKEDITARKQMEEALRAKDEGLREMTQQLWQVAKLATMGELAASIAHELNNPLAIISLRVEGLLAQVSGPAHQALEVVTQEVERMARLVENLLNFSRRRPPQISSLDLRQEVDNTLELIHYHLRNQGIELVRDFAPELPLVQADRQQVRQVFLNLFTNAGDAMPQGGVLTVRAHLVEEGVAIEIADTGVGIAPEDLPKVMEPFFTTKEEGRGTGLGLAICRRVVQEHGGSIYLDSEVGRGTTVRVVFPLGNGENAAQLREE